MRGQFSEAGSQTSATPTSTHTPQLSSASKRYHHHPPPSSRRHLNPSSECKIHTQSTPPISPNRIAGIPPPLLCNSDVPADCLDCCLLLLAINWTKTRESTTRSFIFPLTIRLPFRSANLGRTSGSAPSLHNQARQQTLVPNQEFQINRLSLFLHPFLGPSNSPLTTQATFHCAQTTHP